MKTLEEIKKFIIENNTGYIEVNTQKDMQKGIYDKAILYLLSQIYQDEEVHLALCTSGVYSGSRAVAGGKVIFFITNKRILYGCKDFLSATLKSISFDDCNDIESNTLGIFTGKIYINTKTEKISFEIDKKHCLRIANTIDALIKDICKEKKSEATVVVQQVSGANELLMYKQLLDQGIITQEEFEAKKKQILGL